MDAKIELIGIWRADRKRNDGEKRITFIDDPVYNNDQLKDVCARFFLDGESTNYYLCKKCPLYSTYSAITAKANNRKFCLRQHMQKTHGSLKRTTTIENYIHVHKIKWDQRETKTFYHEANQLMCRKNLSYEMMISDEMQDFMSAICSKL